MNRSTEPLVNPLSEKCVSCGGEGKVPTRSGYEPCGHCNGSGQVAPSASSFNRGEVTAHDEVYPADDDDIE